MCQVDLPDGFSWLRFRWRSSPSGCVDAHAHRAECSCMPAGARALQVLEVQRAFDRTAQPGALAARVWLVLCFVLHMDRK